MRSSIKIPNTLTINGLKIHTIVFDDGHKARIIGETFLQEQLQHLEIIMDFGQLNDYLRFSGAAGDEVLLAMVNALSNASQPPYAINVATLMPYKNIFTQCNLTLQINNNAIYDLMDLEPINLMQQSKNLVQHIRNFGFAQLSNPLMHDKCMQHLKSQFAYYLGLLELDIREDAARDKAQITDERLFEMAKFAFTNFSDCR